MLYGGLPGPVSSVLATTAWGWHSEAGLHALRLVAGGVFDRHPRLRVIVGHCGEMLPFMLGRIDDVLPPSLTGLAAPPSEYFLRHVWVTTSGMFSVPPVLCSISVFGVDRVLFSVDYPFGANASGRALLDALPISPADKAKVAGLNAERLLRLSLTGSPASLGGRTGTGSEAGGRRPRTAQAAAERVSSRVRLLTGSVARGSCIFPSVLAPLLSVLSEFRGGK